LLGVDGRSAEHEEQQRMFNTAKLKSRGGDRLFIITVVVPMILSTLYFGFLASDVYVSESHFVIRSPEKPAATGLGAILQSAGFSNAGDEVFAAQSYAASRDALKAINVNQAVQKAYTRPDIFVLDRFNPFNRDGSFEQLYKYFIKKVKIQNDPTTSITTLTVRAFTAKDARDFNEKLLTLSEDRVNRLNQRGRKDLIGYAQKEVDAAKIKSQTASLALAAFRNRSGVIDPEKQAEVQMQMVSKLQDLQLSAKSELAQLQRFTPLNPRIPVVRSQLASVQKEIDTQLGKVVGDRRSLAADAGRYQRLVLETEFADKQLTGALTSLETARNESVRQQAYVERIVQPNLPDSPIEPRRLRGILATLALSLIAYGILRMLLAGVREHAQ
jgi:capsular polysaccharide transport system permease protein